MKAFWVFQGNVKLWPRNVKSYCSRLRRQVVETIWEALKL